MPRGKSKKELLHTPKGTRDVLPREIKNWEFVESKAKEIASYYGFRQIRTPHIEKTELFTPIGEATDIVEKQMYSFRTRGGDHLSLRPEGTIPVMRSYFQNGMQAMPQPVALYYCGNFFRHERPQRGRFREFSQFGLEMIGEEGAIADAIIIRVLTLILEELNLGQFTVHINTLGDNECRPAYRKELVNYYRRKANYLCKNCRNRLKSNPLRLLDCVEEKCAELKKDAPQMIEYACDACRKHFSEVFEYLDELQIPYFLDHHLVRGLDYYSRTVFEIFYNQPYVAEEPKPVEVLEQVGAGGEVKEEAEAEADVEAEIEDSSVKKLEEHARDKDAPDYTKLAVASGGRYDYLANILGSKKIAGVGGALGLDRIVEMIIKSKKNIVKNIPPKIFLVQLGPRGKQQSLILLEELRKARMSAGSALTKDSLKNQLKIADNIGVRHALILGQKEAIDGTVIVRDMVSGGQETIEQNKLLDYFKKLKKNK